MYISIKQNLYKQDYKGSQTFNFLSISGGGGGKGLGDKILEI